MSPSGTSTGSATRSRTIRVVAAVKDLFFVARIRETARLVGADLTFARTPEEAAAALARSAPELAIVDLTAADLDRGALLDALRPVPVLGYTTHALAHETQPLHARCARVVTRETLTRELGKILAEGIAA